MAALNILSLLAARNILLMPELEAVPPATLNTAAMQPAVRQVE